MIFQGLGISLTNESKQIVPPVGLKRKSTNGMMTIWAVNLFIPFDDHQYSRYLPCGAGESWTVFVTANSVLMRKIP